MSTTANPSDDRAKTIHERHAAMFADSRHNTDAQKGESEGGQSEGGRSSGGGMSLDMAQKANKGDQEPIQSAPAAQQAPTLKPSAAGTNQDDAQKADAQEAPTRADDIHRRHTEMYGANSRHHPDYQGAKDTAQEEPQKAAQGQSPAAAQGEPNKAAEAPAKTDAQKAEPAKATQEPELRNFNAIRVPDDIREWRAHKAEMAKADSSSQSQAQVQTQAQVQSQGPEVEKARPRTMR